MELRSKTCIVLFINKFKKDSNGIDLELLKKIKLERRAKKNL